MYFCCREILIAAYQSTKFLSPHYRLIKNRYILILLDWSVCETLFSIKAYRGWTIENPCFYHVTFVIYFSWWKLVEHFEWYHILRAIISVLKSSGSKSKTRKYEQSCNELWNSGKCMSILHYSESITNMLRLYLVGASITNRILSPYWTNS